MKEDKFLIKSQEKEYNSESEEIKSSLDNLTIFEKKKKLKSIEDIKEVREIVAEIKKFGISDFQICHLIKTLALELEFREDIIDVKETIESIIDKRNYNL